MPNRRSGLSVPYRSMASAQVIARMVGGRSPVAASAASSTASDTNPSTSSWLDEGRLDVELGELELAVGPEVLVPQAPGDLVVPVHAGHHEELLGQLRALGQDVAGARV